MEIHFPSPIEGFFLEDSHPLHEYVFSTSIVCGRNSMNDKLFLVGQDVDQEHVQVPTSKQLIK